MSCTGVVVFPLSRALLGAKCTLISLHPVSLLSLTLVSKKKKKIASYTSC